MNILLGIVIACIIVSMVILAVDIFHFRRRYKKPYDWEFWQKADVVGVSLLLFAALVSFGAIVYLAVTA